MKIITLKNGLKVYLQKTNSTTVTVQANVMVGSAFENSKEAGYSHFVEHMLFEGTKNRNNFDIANDVEKIGGELNGATSSDRTMYYIKVPKKHGQVALDIISDILVNASFEKKMFDKEKTVILSEIDIYQDDPKLHQWNLLENNLFDSSLGKPTLGTKSSIKSCKKEDLVNYYKKYYTSNNIFLTISGGFSNFDFKELEKLEKGEETFDLKENKLSKSKKVVEKRKISQSYINIGYKTTSRNTKEAVVFDVIHAILGRGVSGKLFDEIRNKKGLGYSVHVYNETGKFSGMFAVSVSTKKDNLDKVERIVKKNIKDLKNLSPKELDEAKEYIIGKHEMEKEDTRYIADDVAEWIYYSDIKSMRNYFNILNKVTKKDVLDVVDKYMKNNVVVRISEK